MPMTAGPITVPVAQVSADGTNWVTVYDSAVSGEYQETAQGKEITFANPKMCVMCVTT